MTPQIERVDGHPVGTLTRITYGGYRGTYWQPPEDGEAIGFCPECGAETDIALPVPPDRHGPVGYLTVTCVTGHEFLVADPGDPYNDL